MTIYGILVLIHMHFYTLFKFLEGLVFVILLVGITVQLVLVKKLWPEVAWVTYCWYEFPQHLFPLLWCHGKEDSYSNGENTIWGITGQHITKWWKVAWQSHLDEQGILHEHQINLCIVKSLRFFSWYSGTI